MRLVVVGFLLLAIAMAKMDGQILTGVETKDGNLTALVAGKTPENKNDPEVTAAASKEAANVTASFLVPVPPAGAIFERVAIVVGAILLLMFVCLNSNENALPYLGTVRPPHHAHHHSQGHSHGHHHHHRRRHHHGNSPRHSHSKQEPPSQSESF